MSNRTLALGVFTLIVVILLYHMWPYLIAFLVLVGAAQVYRVIRARMER